MNQIIFDYHYEEEAERYTFIRLPKALYTEDMFRKLSDGSKVLYELYSGPQVVDFAADQSSPQVVDLRDILFSIPWGHLSINAREIRRRRCFMSERP